MPLGYSQPGTYMSGGYSHIVWVGVCHWVTVSQVGTCQGVLPYSLGRDVPLGYSQPGMCMSGGYSHIVWMVVCHWVTVSQVGTCQGGTPI